MAEFPIDKNEINNDSSANNSEKMNESSGGDTEHMSEEDEHTKPDISGSPDNNSYDTTSVNDATPDIKGATDEQYADLSKPYVGDRRREERDGSERRRHERSGFIYPVVLKIFSSQLSNSSFDGYIEDISISGAGIMFEDKYGRVELEGVNGSSIKIIVRMPHGDDVTLLSTIRWIIRDVSDNTIIKVGIEFQKMEEWQIKTINQLISLKNKDQNMMWTLFENYEKNIR